MHRGVPLHAQLKTQMMPHIERLWGHDVALEEIAGD
jgi:spore cortex formation protein SpoVR/YcgB (stage V sporulation)